MAKWSSFLIHQKLNTEAAGWFTERGSVVRVLRGRMHVELAHMWETSAKPANEQKAHWESHENTLVQRNTT